MGCQVALEWCRAHSHRVAGIALILGTPQHSLDSVLGGAGDLDPGLGARG